MPLRTGRGRAAVLRRIWGWPLRSPGHLAIAAVVLAAATMVVSAVISHR